MAAPAPPGGVRRLPLAAHALPARAVPLERQLHGGRHQRRRRGQLLPRPRGDALPRRTPPATRAASTSTCATCAAAPVWAATHQPVGREAEEYLATFQPEKATFRRRDDGIATRLEIAVSTEDDVEVRRLLVSNQADRPREIEVDELRRDRARAAGRRPRAPGVRQALRRDRVPPRQRGAALPAAHRAPPDEGELWAVHVLALEGRPQGRVEWETDRARFLGRGRDVARPAGARRPFAVRHHRRRARSDREPAPAPAARARRLRAARLRDRRGRRAATPRSRWRRSTATRAPSARTFALAFVHAQSGLRHLGISGDEALLFERLASRVLYADALAARAGRGAGAQRARPGGPLAARRSRATCRSCSCAWSSATTSPLVRQLLQAQEYWRLKGLAADVVILNEHPIGYLDEMHVALETLLDGGPWRAWKHRPGGVYLLRGERLSEAERTLLLSVARAVLSGEHGDLAHQLARPDAPPRPHRSAGVRRLATRRRRRPDARRRRVELPPLLARTTASAASAPTGASTSSSWTATARRRCRGST